MPLDTCLDGLQAVRRFVAVTRQHVEGQLLVEHLLWQRVKGKQMHRLLMQFVNTGLAAFTRRLKNMNHPPCDRVAGTQTPEEQSENAGSRVSNHIDGGGPVRGSGEILRFAIVIGERRSQSGARVIF